MIKIAIQTATVSVDRFHRFRTCGPWGLCCLYWAPRMQSFVNAARPQAAIVFNNNIGTYSKAPQWSVRWLVKRVCPFRSRHLSINQIFLYLPSTPRATHKIVLSVPFNRTIGRSSRTDSATVRGCWRQQHGKVLSVLESRNEAQMLLKSKNSNAIVEYIATVYRTTILRRYNWLVIGRFVVIAECCRCSAICERTNWKDRGKAVFYSRYSRGYFIWLFYRWRDHAVRRRPNDSIRSRFKCIDYVRFCTHYELWFSHTLTTSGFV